MRKTIPPFFLCFMLISASSTLENTAESPVQIRRRGSVSLYDVVNVTELRRLYSEVMVNDVSLYDEYMGWIDRWHPMYFGYPILTGNDTFPYIQFGGVHNPYYYPSKGYNETALHWDQVTNTKFVDDKVLVWRNQTFLHWSNGTMTTVENLRCPICDGYMVPFEPEFYSFYMFWQCFNCRVTVCELLGS